MDWMILLFVGAMVLGLYFMSGQVEPSTHDLLMVAIISLMVIVILPQVI
ncbi:hypothetical protein ES703_114222 [subsurface metagenome]